MTCIVQKNDPFLSAILNPPNPSPQDMSYEQWVGGLYQRQDEVPVHERLYMEAGDRYQQQYMQQQTQQHLAETREQEDDRECVFRPALSDRTAQLANRVNTDSDVISRLTRKPQQLTREEEVPRQPAPRPPRTEGPSVWERLGKQQIQNFRDAPGPAQTTFQPNPTTQSQGGYSDRPRANVFDRLYPSKPSQADAAPYSDSHYIENENTFPVTQNPLGVRTLDTAEGGGVLLPDARRGAYTAHPQQVQLQVQVCKTFFL